MRMSVDLYARIVEVFKSQPAHRRPNMRAASRALGIDARTLSTGWRLGWPKTSTHPRLPPLAEAFETSDAISRVAPTPTPSLPTTSPTPAPPPTDAPTPPPGGEPRARQAERIAFSSRETVIGLLATGSGFLKTIYEAAPKLKEHLLSTAIERPDRAVALLVDLSKVVEAAVRSGERLANLQLIEQGSPTAIARVEHRAPAPAEKLSDEEILRRQKLVWRAVAEVNREFAQEDDAEARTIDVTTSDSDAAIKAGHTVEAEALTEETATPEAQP